jgi:hypothetical protein
MDKERRSLICIFFILVFALGLLIAPMAQAQNWALMPPYNVLWPLWSPPLVTDFNWDPLVLRGTVPIVTELTRNTILPVQPAIAWDPATSIWALYNTPPLLGSGLLFFDRVYGLNSWPPPYLYDSVAGAPIPITFLTTWGLLKPPGFAGGGEAYFISLANAIYSLTYGLTGPEFLNLLTASQLWGLGPISTGI